MTTRAADDFDTIRRQLERIRSAEGKPPPPDPKMPDGRPVPSVTVQAADPIWDDLDHAVGLDAFLAPVIEYMVTKLVEMGEWP